MNRLEGKAALVTGGTRGIGEAIARAFANEGASVLICSRKQEGVDAALGRLRNLPGRIAGLAAHVGRPADMRLAVDTALREFGKIDILVNNAATNVAQGSCLTFDDAQFDKMVEVNLKSVFRLVRLVAPGMLERGAGAIINIASIAGQRPQHESLLYSMTKAALIMMTQSYAVEFGPRGVRVNAIAPGLVQTALSEFFWKDPERSAKLMALQPVKHLGQPAEIAGIAVMLGSDDASYLTGQTITVDGGRLLAW